MLCISNKEFKGLFGTMSTITNAVFGDRYMNLNAEYVVNIYTI